MKKYSFLLLALLLSAGMLSAQKKDYRVVFDLTSKDSIDQKNAIRWLNEISESNPDAKLEVVMYSKGIEMVVRGKSYVSDDVSRLAANKNIAFKVCAIAMQNNGVTMDQLLPGVQAVPDGIYEIISKQRDGWGYIKAAR